MLRFNTNFWVGMIVMVFMVIGLFYLAKGVFTLLAWAAPVLFILTLILRHKVVLQYGKMLINLVKRNPLMGILAIVLTVIGFPIVAFALFGKAMLDRKVDKMQGAYRERVDGEYVDYEVVDDELLDLPDMEQRRSSTDYEDIFSNE